MTTRSLSLIEQKRLQWNREREEMTKFYGLWAPSVFQLNQRKISDGCIIHLNKLHEVYELDDSSLNRCLPPIQKNAYNESNNRINDVRNYSECNTSGYGSETDIKEQLMFDKKKQWKSQSNLHSETASTISTNDHIDDNSVRMKWGDRGVGVGHLWEPTLNSEARLPEINNRPGTPHWLQRSLLDKTHFRGQNVPNEPDTILIREQKKLKALELQEAIKQQLQEREKKRKEDKEQQLEEERKLDQRVKKQQELEKIRIEEELKKQKEKEEKETKKSKIMQEALATAEQLAKEAKTKNRHKFNDNKPPDNNNNEISKKLLHNDQEHDDSQDENIPPRVVEKYEQQKKINEMSKNDASTSLTSEKYYEDFQTTIPLITNKWTQTNTCLIPEVRKKILKCSSERPKWGVNRPNTKYLKQSEKDLFYQRKGKHRYRRDRFEQEPSGSSRSFDSTDESKSFSTSPNEKDFEQSDMCLNLNLREKFSKCYINDKSENESTKSPKSDKNILQNHKIMSKEGNLSSNEELLNQLEILSNNLVAKQAYWKEEVKKLPPELLANSQHTP